MATLRAVMPSFPRTASFAFLLFAACAQSEDSVSSTSALAPVSADREFPAGTEYRGEFVLRGDAALLATGSASIAIVSADADTPVLQRTWDLGDPAWRVGDGERRLYFALDARDAWPGADARIAAEMDLVVRFDPDGNPATDELGVAQDRSRVRTGARDLLVELAIGSPVAAGSFSSGD